MNHGIKVSPTQSCEAFFLEPSLEVVIVTWNSGTNTCNQVLISNNRILYVLWFLFCSVAALRFHRLDYKLIVFLVYNCVKNADLLPESEILQD